MRRRPGTLLLILIFLFSIEQPQAASRRPLTAKRGMVASVSEIASQIGIETLRKGGNAVDAAVAVAFALAVVWPEAGNLGGGGFILIRKADGSEEAIDYRERAPLLATRDMYLDPAGNLISETSTFGHKAVAVPGTIAGLALSLKRYGKLQWKDVIEPARKLAKEGFVVSPVLTDRFRIYEKKISRFPETKQIFLRNGRYFEAGERLRQPQLARTLRRLQQQGPREFYEGQTANLIVQDMKRNGGLITTNDLRQYEPTIRKPLHGTYRGYEIMTMPPPSSGGVALIEMLNMLESFDLASRGFQSSDHLHPLIEVMKRAFADRAGFLGDPDLVNIPLERFVSKQYAAAAAKTIDARKATPANEIKAGTLPSPEGASTTHFTIVDAEEMVVCNSFTLNDAFGSGVTVPDAGFLLNNEMDDFTAKPGAPNLYGLLQSEANAIAPRKRPLSSMTPVIVLKDGKPFFAVGAAGGPAIISLILQVIVGVIDFHLDIQEAIDAPRFHHQWAPDAIYFESSGLNEDTRAALESRGHHFSEKYFFTETKVLGDAHAVMIVPGSRARLGASDPRRGGAPAGY